MVTYTPDSALREPRRLVAGMWTDVRAAWRIGLRLAIRDLDAQYRQTALGYLWAIVPVLVTAGLWIALNRATVLRVETAMPYWLFVLSGTVFWQTFVDALNGPLAQFQSNRLLLSRVNFPKEALLVSACIQVLVSTVLRLAAVAIVCLGVGADLDSRALLTLAPVAGLVLLGMVLGTLLVPAGALFGDIGKLVWVLTTPVMLVSPVAYPPQAVQGALRTVMEWNPLTPLIGLARNLLVGGEAHWYGAASVIAASVVVMALGWVLYRLAVPILVEKLEA